MDTGCFVRACFIAGLVTAIPSGVAEGQFRSTANQSLSCRVLIDSIPTDVDQAAAGKAEIERLEKCLARVASSSSTVLARLRKSALVNDTIEVMDGDAIVARVAPSEINTFLINQHSAYRRFKRWVSAYRRVITVPETKAQLSEALSAADDSLHAALELRGLNQVFSAVLMTGAIIGSGAGGDAEDSERTTSATAHLIWESKHIGTDDEGFAHMSHRGRIGFIPALMLVKESATASEESVYQEAFVWDLAARLNRPVLSKHASEFTAYVRVGQTLLNTNSVLIDRGPASVLALPVDNGARRAEWFYEGGLEFNAFNTSLDVVHAEGSAISSLFSISLAYRKDSRFKKQGDLVAFTAPEDRGVFRFLIDALRVVDKRQASDAPRVFTLGFGVEHEFSLQRGDNTVPVGSNFIFRGDVDLLRALQGK